MTYGTFTPDRTSIASVNEPGGAAASRLLHSQGRGTHERRARKAQHGHSLRGPAPLTRRRLDRAPRRGRKPPRSAALPTHITRTPQLTTRSGTHEALN